MEMKLKLGEVLNLNQILKIIIDDSQSKIDLLLKFKLLGIMKTIEPLIQNFEIIRNEKINEYGEKTEDGRASIPVENKEAIEKFNADIKKLINEEVTVNITKFKLSDIFDKGLKVEHLLGLYPIIEE
ncbi:MAG: hypothetical protein IJE43_10290 [Alphaproteobacteria bacterium]|nr:hypothetical protein [Alphaproteobacteria bacterium]MBQ6817375.1 hypothetical protein [Bacilli bacterium]